jgi:uncharacterized protein YciI
LKKVLTISILLMLCQPLRAQEFHIVFLNKKEDKAALPEEEVKKLMDGHMANINRLAKEGKLWAAGPFDGGGGLFIFKTSSMEDVRGWILTDPAVAAGRWNVEIFPYVPRSGSVCSVGENYVMTNYFFVRYTMAPGKSDAVEIHRNYIAGSGKQATVVAEAGLGEGNGSILVLGEEPAKEWLNGDPSVKAGNLVPSLKKLYIAKGPFCEPR